MIILSIRNFTKHKIDRSYLFYVAGKTLKKASYGKSAEISLVVAGTRRIRKLNSYYRAKDKVTDVLSFGNPDKKNAIRFVVPPRGAVNLGEIFICYSKAKEQAKEKNHSFKREISILFIHGILHLLGYDHEKDAEAVVMQKMEKEVLDSL